MKRHFSIVMMLAALITGTNLFSQVPKTLSYQGVLTDTTGAPVPDGQYQLTLNLYAQASGGSSLWSETQLANAKNGVFSVIFGFSYSVRMAMQGAHFPPVGQQQFK